MSAFDEILAGNWWDAFEHGPGDDEPDGADSWPVYPDVDDAIQALDGPDSVPMRAWIQSRHGEERFAVKVYPSGHYRDTRVNE